MKISLFDLLARVANALQEKVSPKEVDKALAEEWDLEEWARHHGGVAPPDAPHIDEGGI